MSEQQGNNLKLHVRRVWMDDRDELIPEWFNFVGVRHDFPLRFSREALPQGKESLRRSASKCLQELQRKTATGSSANSLNISKSLVNCPRFITSMFGVKVISVEEGRSLSAECFERHALHHW